MKCLSAPRIYNRNRPLLVGRKSLICLGLILMFVLMAPQVISTQAATWPNPVDAANRDGVWPALTDIPAKAYLVVDANTGETILAMNENEQLYPASTTKIMTALLVLSDPAYDPDQVLTASENAVNLGWDSSKIHLMADETIRMQDALAGLMLASGNDVANVIAENIGGSIEAFALRMTGKAQEIGAAQTNFMNPHGLHDEQHYTTAFDLSLIARAAMERDDFRTLVSTTSYSLPASNKHKYNGWNTMFNSNRLIHFDQSYLYSDYLQEIIGIKTGTTNAAGYCLVSGARTHDGRELISVLLGIPMNENQGNTWIYSRTLLEQAAKTIGAPAIPLAEFLEKQDPDLPVDEPEQPQPEDPGDSTEPGDTSGDPPVLPTKPVISDTPDVSQSDGSWLNRLIDGPASGFWFWASLLLGLLLLILIMVIVRLNRRIHRMRKRIRTEQRSGRIDPTR